MCPSDGQRACMSKMLSCTVYAVRVLISAVPYQILAGVSLIALWLATV